MKKLHPRKPKKAELTPNEMLNELLRLGYIIPDDKHQPVMPSALKPVPSFTTADTIPINFSEDGD